MPLYSSLGDKSETLSKERKREREKERKKFSIKIGHEHDQRHKQATRATLKSLGDKAGVVAHTCSPRTLGG